MDTLSFMSNTENIQPLMDVIEQIMGIPEENLTSENTEVISGMIMGAFTPKMREDAISEMIRGFERQNLNRKEARELVEKSRAEIESGIDGLQPSAHKRAILDSIFDFFYDIFDKALEKYHGYAFELPVTIEKEEYLPSYAHDTDACADVYASQTITIPAHSLGTKVPTGLRIALPEGWVAKIAPRSSIGAKTGLRLSNSIGIIDQDYRGEIGILYDNISDSDYTIEAGSRIAQIWVEPVYRFKPVAVDILPATERGEGGFGSSGK